MTALTAGMQVQTGYVRGLA